MSRLYRYSSRPHSNPIPQLSRIFFFPCSIFIFSWPSQAPGSSPDSQAGLPAPHPAAAHLRQVLVVEQMRLAGLEAVLTLALVEDVGLKFPARVFLGRRHVA